MRLKIHNAKPQSIRGSINHDGGCLGVILTMMAGLALGFAKRHGSPILSLIGIVLLVLAGITFVSVFWQSYQRSRPFKMKKLNLTAEQKKKIKLVIADQGTKFVELHKDRSLSLADRRERAKSINDDTDAKLKELFTADQYAKYQDMRKPITQHSPPIASGNTSKSDSKQN